MEAEVVSSSSNILQNLILLALLVNFLATVFLHHAEELTLYTDYSDVSWNLLGTIGVIALALLMGFIGISSDWVLWICGALFVGSALWILKRAIQVNGILFGLMAFIAKYTVVAFYIFALFKIFTSYSNSRRKRRDEDNSKWWVLILTAIVGFVIKFTVRYEEFLTYEEFIQRKENGFEDSEDMDQLESAEA